MLQNPGTHDALVKFCTHEHGRAHKNGGSADVKFFQVLSAMPLEIKRNASARLEILVDSTLASKDVDVDTLGLKVFSIGDQTLASETLDIDVTLEIKPQLVSMVQFSDDLTSVQMLFANFSEVLPSTTIECKAILEEASLVKMGVAPQCLINVPLELGSTKGVGASVQLGSRPTIAVGDKPVLVASLAKLARADIKVEKPSKAEAPTAVIRGPSMVGPCGSVTFDGSLST